jgi:hypothetical protein
MTVLFDDADHRHPTFENITEAFKTLSEQSQPGDAVFVMFSGHGGRVLDSHSDEEAESYDEVIAPVDYQTSGVIRDTLILKTLLAPLRYGVTQTLLVDTCDTGMIMDLPYSWSTKKDKREAIPKVSVIYILSNRISFKQNLIYTPASISLLLMMISVLSGS